MTALATTHHEALMLSGPAFARGRGQSGTGGGELAEKVRKATVGRVEAARDAGWLTPGQRDYIVAQRRFAETEDPDGLSELAGIAEGFGLDEEELFLHLHLGTLRDLAEGASLDDDGCSAWAAGHGPDGPLVVKNRDFGGTHLGVQRLMWHQGPDITTGGMMCLGSLGSPGAYSSGMNAAGLALADTQIGSTIHAVGWLRYFLMTRLLATCPTVEVALDRICATRHAGGGSLVMADATGATAAVELGANQVVVTRGALSWHTNHFFSAELAAQTLIRGGGRIAANSTERLDCLSATLPRRSWNVAGAAALMARHDNDPEGAPICQHPGPEDDTLTISSVIYAIDQRCVYLHEGNPCAGRWQSIRLPA